MHCRHHELLGMNNVMILMQTLTWSPLPHFYVFLTIIMEHIFINNLFYILNEILMHHTNKYTKTIYI